VASIGHMEVSKYADHQKQSNQMFMVETTARRWIRGTEKQRQDIFGLSSAIIYHGATTARPVWFYSYAPEPGGLECRIIPHRL